MKKKSNFSRINLQTIKMDHICKVQIRRAQLQTNHLFKECSNHLIYKKIQTNTVNKSSNIKIKMFKDNSKL